jgi:hypothetical protein
LHRRIEAWPSRIFLADVDADLCLYVIVGSMDRTSVSYGAASILAHVGTPRPESSMAMMERLILIADLIMQRQELPDLRLVGCHNMRR